MAGFERRKDPDRPGGLLLLRDGEPVGLVWWAHDFGDRSATGWFVQPLDAEGEPDEHGPRRLDVAPDVRALRDDEGLDRTAWIARAETLELVTAPAALDAAEQLLAGLLDR
jgi:hypothetical protein